MLAQERLDGRSRAAGPCAPLASAAMMRRAWRPIAAAGMLALMLALVLAPVAQANNDGRGLYGATNDKVVTNAGFLLVVFFPTFVFVMSMIQRSLEKRKEARKAARKARVGNAQWRGGW
jgi:hypothetical protein